MKGVCSPCCSMKFQGMQCVKAELDVEVFQFLQSPSGMSVFVCYKVHAIQVVLLNYYAIWP